MTTTEQKQKQEMVLPSFFYAIASSESRQLISLDELQRIITLDAMTQARTEDYRKNMRISSELAHQTKVYHHYSVPTILQVVTRICFRKKLFYYRF